MLRLGAESIYSLGLGDDSSEEGLDEGLHNWLDGIWPVSLALMTSNNFYSSSHDDFISRHSFVRHRLSSWSLPQRCHIFYQ
jgi:hypothetical protein